MSAINYHSARPGINSRSTESKSFWSFGLSRSLMNKPSCEPYANCKITKLINILKVFFSSFSRAKVMILFFIFSFNSYIVYFYCFYLLPFRHLFLFYYNSSRERIRKEICNKNQSTIKWILFSLKEMRKGISRTVDSRFA